MKPIVRSILCCALAASSPVLAAGTHPLSWGKVGVSFEQYRADAVDCGRSGYYLDVSDTKAAEIFRHATRRLETNESGGSGLTLDTAITSARIIEGARPDVRMEEVRQLLQGTVDGCLIERGYTPFRLSAEQNAKLRRLRTGSPERHAYLYGLATDPKVLDSQAISFVLADPPPR